MDISHETDYAQQKKEGLLQAERDNETITEDTARIFRMVSFYLVRGPHPGMQQADLRKRLRG